MGFVTATGGNYETIREKYPNETFAKVYTFNSARKMMSTIVKSQETPGYMLFAKGASEMVLSKCAYYIDKNGEPVEMSQSKINSLITDVVEKMASNGLRTICVASRQFMPNDESEKNINMEVYDKGKCQKF